MTFDAPNPDYADQVARVFRDANFINDLGVELVRVGPGLCETRLPLAPRHLQQTGSVHAGVSATLADHTAGGAGTSLCPPGSFLLTTNLSVVYLRAAVGDHLRCTARVVKAGRVVTAESEVFFDRPSPSGPESLLAVKATVTMVLVEASPG